MADEAGAAQEGREKQEASLPFSPEQQQIASALTGRYSELAAPGALRARADGWLEVNVPREKLLDVAGFLRDAEGLAFDFLSCISAVDYREKGFQVVYHLLSLLAGKQLVLKIDVPDREHPSLPSVVELWPTANWYEREAWDLMGIHFEGHPDLRRILMREDWVGHPLRKDYVDQRPSRQAQRQANWEKAKSRF